MRPIGRRSRWPGYLLTSILVLYCAGCCGDTARVLVAERDTGRPVPNAVVRPYYDVCFFGHPTGPGRPFRTDAQGRATVRVLDAIRIYGFTVEAEGYEQFLPDGWSYSVGTYEGEAAADGTRVLHVRPVTERGAGAE